MLRNHGQSRKYYHDVEGYNGRLDAIQAGILQVKLKHLQAWNEQRREAAGRYNELFAVGLGEWAPYEPNWSKAVYHLYVLRTQERDGLMRSLGEAKIGTGIHYPVPLHLQKAYQGLGYKRGDFPVTEEAAGEILSLPMFPGLRGEEQARIAGQIESFVGDTVRTATA